MKVLRCVIGSLPIFAGHRPTELSTVRRAGCPEIWTTLAVTRVLHNIHEVHLLCQVFLDVMEWSRVGFVTCSLRIKLSARRRYVSLARHAHLMVAGDDARNVKELSQAVQAVHVSLRVLVEVDVGQHHCSVQPGEPARALARQVATG
jgi:hypothetical protein